MTNKKRLKKIRDNFLKVIKFLSFSININIIDFLILNDYNSKIKKKIIAIYII